MSHVDEGALHAYLDGALDEYPAAEAHRIREHLEECAECARRLEDERALRSDAHAMLGLAAPEVDLPSLEELRAYVKRTRPVKSGASVRVVRMSWAASVMLALGTGWILRGGRIDPVPSFESVALERPGEPAGDQPQSTAVAAAADAGISERLERGALDDDFTPGIASPVRTMNEEEDAGSGLQAPPALAGASFADRADLPAGSVAQSVTPLEADARLSEKQMEEVASVDVDAVEVRLDEAVAERPVAEVSAARAFTTDRVVAEGMMAREAVPVDFASSSPTPVGPPDSLGAVESGGAANAASVAGAPAPAEPQVEEEEARAERRRADSRVAVTSAMNSRGRGGVREVPENDERFKDEPAQAVPGFEVVSVDNLGEGRVFNGTVVLQRLEGEEMLEIFHLEPEVDPSILSPLASNLNEVRVETETGWVIMRGPRSEDELEILLVRLFPT